MDVQVICLFIILGALSILGQLPVEGGPKSAKRAPKLRKQRDNLKTSSSCVCGDIPWRIREKWPGDLAPRIVGGVKALRNEHPMLATIYNKGIFTCGGSVVSRYHILTAAHCVEDSTAKDMDVYLGVFDNNKLNKAKHFPVREIIRHSGYKEINGSFVVDDIALLRVDRIKFRKSIRPICIPFNASPDMQWMNQAAVAGWGVTTFNGNASRFPLRAILRVMSHEECINTAWGPTMKDIPNSDQKVVCAYSPGVDACQGDSGGPLFARSNGTTYQLGIVSFGDECANSKGIPGIYMSLTYYKDWLWKHLSKVSCLQPF